MALKHKMDKRQGHHQKILVRDLNSVLTCKLCEGYFVDATTLVECLHTFCRSCIIRYLETSKTQCPVCPTDKKKPQIFRPDPQMQTLIYKLVPSLYFKEMQRREDFYRSTGLRAGSSCSDDSVIDRERDMMNETEETIDRRSGDKTQYLSPEDSISLSLEYYQAHLDDTDVGTRVPDQNSAKIPEEQNVRNVKGGDKRYLSCPAAVNMKHLQKFVRMKYGVTSEHRVDIIYRGEVLTSDFSLMDVAYTFKWERKKPMRFFYRIFTPSKKIRPIKIVNTASPSGEKQLQVVPLTPNPEKPPQTKPEPKEESENEKQDKERLFAHLQLQSKAKTAAPAPAPPPAAEKLIKDCVFEYEEPDQEEIKRFAEKRDREWALQKKFEEDTRQEEEYSNYHVVAKKRKKSKHSKNESNSYKKRKLHAEITSNEKEDLKLKVKITSTNGHKHKHHRVMEISAKEKLLQMRQVRHKHVGSDQPTASFYCAETKKTDPLKIEPVVIKTSETAKAVAGPSRTNDKPYQISTNNKSLDRKIASLQQRCTIEPKNSTTVFGGEKTPRYPPGFTVSKVEAGVKRKADGDEDDKRPSLEITLINPTADSKPVKRPLPGTIPLERIKNSVNLKSGISIIPKMPDRCDNIGALDLSKPDKPKPEHKQVNGLGKASSETAVQLSNLQMLSKVATEHSTLNKILPNTKPRPQVPSLQTIKLPAPIRGPALQRLPPKLNEIQKFKPVSPQIRSLRPNQNQNIRNIPNPSLLMNRQSRLAATASATAAAASTPQTSEEKKEEAAKPVAAATPPTAGAQKEGNSVKSAIVLEQKVMAEKKEISV